MSDNSRSGTGKLSLTSPSAVDKIPFAARAAHPFPGEVGPVHRLGRHLEQ